MSTDRNDPAPQTRFATASPVMLQISVTETVVQWQDESDSQVMQVRLPFGHANLLGTNTSPPSAFEIETAIEIVEEHVMPLARKIERASSREILVQNSPVPASFASELDSTFNLDAVERGFSNIAAIAQGRPYSSMEPVKMRLLSASVLILREFMHHFGIEHGTVNCLSG
jgi:hypothetical protein